jgi:hypothetical protein
MKKPHYTEIINAGEGNQATSSQFSRNPRSNSAAGTGLLYR